MGVRGFSKRGSGRTSGASRYGKREKEHLAELGWWGMELAKRLVESQKVPIFIVNGARGGTRIDQHQRNDENPTDLDTIYGRMLWRVKEARLTHGIRAIIWHQGENDQGAAGPDGGYGWETYQRYFVEMSADWKRDFPNVSRLLRLPDLAQLVQHGRRERRHAQGGPADLAPPVFEHGCHVDTRASNRPGHAIIR